MAAEDEGDREEANAFQIELKYIGSDTEDHRINLYDLSQALYGFERSLALTTHLVLNDEVITQATALKGARILASPPEEGSFSLLATVSLILGAGYKITTLKRDNPLGHLVHSCYDYLVHRVTGQGVDYDRTLREIYEESQAERFGLSLPRTSQLDSLAEKIEPPLTRIHRPFTRSGTADEARVTFSTTTGRVYDPIKFDHDTYSRIKYRLRQDEITTFEAKVSVFNPNTSNGRLYSPAEQRTIPFYLTHAARSAQAFRLIGESYSRNLNDREDRSALLQFDAIPTTSQLGRLMKYSVVRVRDLDDPDDIIDRYDI